MISGGTAELAGALTAARPSEHARWLVPADEPALRALLRARYGETYSYQSFYEPGRLAALWQSGALLSLGELDGDGELVAHTGLWLYPGRDYVESGLSLVHPRRRGAMTRDEHARMWSYVLERLKTGVAYLHQHTSTLHPLAQRYAQRLMGAVPVGLVIDYTVGEQLIGVTGSGEPMQALAMTTPLRPQITPKPRYLPAGRWFGWLQAIFAGLDAATAIPVEPTRSATGGLLLDVVDENPALSLTRRRVVGVGAGPPRQGGARVDLIHVPVDDPGLVGAASSALAAAGYLPVGVRPGVSQDSVVWQHLPDRRAASSVAARAVLAGEANKTLYSGWIERCAEAS